MRVETWPRVRWLLEIILEIEPADADQCIANFRSFSLAEAVVNQIVADGDAFEQTRDGVRFAAVHGVVRFMLPGAATGQHPLARRLAVFFFATQGVRDREVLGNREIAHDSVEAVVKILINRIG